MAAVRDVEARFDYHNIHSTGRGEQAAEQMLELLADERPVVAVFSEAAFARRFLVDDHGRSPRLAKAGYLHFWRAGNEEARNNVIVIRADAARFEGAPWSKTMTRRWRHKKEKDPRVFVLARVVLEAAGIELNVVGGHFVTKGTGENQQAWDEQAAWMVDVAGRMPAIPFLALIDANASAKRVQEQIGSKLRGHTQAGANGVDHLVRRGGDDWAIAFVEVDELGTYGSDHKAIRYTVHFVSIRPNRIARARQLLTKAHALIRASRSDTKDRGRRAQLGNAAGHVGDALDDLPTAH